MTLLSDLMGEGITPLRLDNVAPRSVYIDRTVKFFGNVLELWPVIRPDVGCSELEGPSHQKLVPRANSNSASRQSTGRQ